MTDKAEVIHLNQRTERQLHSLATALLGRAQLASRLGQSFGTDRDLYVSLGYTKRPVFNDYYARYSRQDIAKRIVNALPNACWKRKPVITENEDKETEFEREWLDLVAKKNVYQYLTRADRISGIGSYGIILLGLNDGKELEQPCTKAYELTFMRPYHEANVSPLTWVTDVHDPRYGLPELYTVQMTAAGGGSTYNRGVHWTRVIHLAEELEEGEVYGTPRMQHVLNRLQDLELIAGGSSEMYWRGAFPGLSFNAQDDAQFGEGQSLSDLEDEIEEYMHGLKRYLRLTGIDIKSLEQQIADPRGHVEVLISLIAGATGIPQRILLGSERGELASTQDETAWGSRIDERNINYVEPVILRPFIDRLIQVGVLSAPSTNKYTVVWPDAHSPSEKELADVAKVKTEALATYAGVPAASRIVPEEVFLKKFLGWTQEEVDQVNEINEEMMNEEDDEIEEDSTFPVDDSDDDGAGGIDDEDETDVE